MSTSFPRRGTVTEIICRFVLTDLHGYLKLSSCSGFIEIRRYNAFYYKHYVRLIIRDGKQ